MFNNLNFLIMSIELKRVGTPLHKDFILDNTKYYTRINSVDEMEKPIVYALDITQNDTHVIIKRTCLKDRVHSTFLISKDRFKDKSSLPLVNLINKITNSDFKNIKID